MAKIKIDFGGANAKLRAEVAGRAVNGEILIDLPAEREWFKRLLASGDFVTLDMYAGPGSTAWNEAGRIYGCTVFTTISVKEMVGLVKEFKQEILEEN